MERFCIVCNDKRKFRSKVNDVERITNVLRTIKAEKIYDSELRSNIELRKIYGNINMDKPSIRFMCGFCHKVNKNELDVAFNRFKDIYISIISALMKTEDEEYFAAVKYKLTRLLSGYFPTCVRVLDRIKFSKDK